MFKNALQNNRNHRKMGRGFTLVELVVVVLILGILAAVAAPRMFDTAGNARDSSTRQSLAVVRDAIQMYRSQNTAYPASATSLPTDISNYLAGSFPTCQVGNVNNSIREATSASDLTTASGSEGWAYLPATGGFVVNDSTAISW